MKKALIYILIWYFVTLLLHAIIFKLTQDKLVYDWSQVLFSLIIAVPCSLFGGLWTYSYDKKILKERKRALKYRMGGAIYRPGLSGPDFEKEFCEFYTQYAGEKVDSFSQIKEQLTGEELFEYCNAYYNYKTTKKQI